MELDAHADQRTYEALANAISIKIGVHPDTLKAPFKFLQDFCGMLLTFQKHTAVQI